ncbi:acyl carrier protein [Saccharopolyspora shandongensis]|uniref:acyl carrier protein n=1 Tax=Saccharopolyspora shandongensis TaxID=418495 RepID=UPI0033FFC3EA
MSGDEQRLREWVLEACQDLGLPLRNDDDDFFEAGGTSLTAAKLIERAEVAFGEDALPPEALFAGSSVGEIVVTLVENLSVTAHNQES